MNKDAIKELMFGGIQEIIRNRKYYYHSPVGSSYSHFTDEGKLTLEEYISILAYKMIEAEEKELDQRAKDIVVRGLKGESV